MEIRHTRPEDLGRLMEIYAYARDFMVRTGNPRQWAAQGWPPRQLLEEDIQAGRSYVCTDEKDGHVIGTFCYFSGKDIEPTYAKIFDGSWKSDAPYGVVHRVASDGSIKGIGRYCIDWAFKESGHLRIDTHPDNKVMQNLLESMGFEKCGIIYVEEDDDPRFAYEKL